MVHLKALINRTLIFLVGWSLTALSYKYDEITPYRSHHIITEI